MTNGGARPEEIITGIDIGTSKVSVCAGSVDEAGNLQIIALSSVAANGIRRGAIVDIESTLSAVSSALEQAERMAGRPLRHAFLAIGGSHIEGQAARGVVAVSKPTGLIEPMDVDRVIEAAKAIALPQNREQIHLFPRSFAVDGVEGIRDPVGMNGVRLEVEALIVSGSSSAVRQLERVSEQAGLAGDAIGYGPLASSKLILNRRQTESGVVALDFGAGSTGLVVYEESEVVHIASIPMGSMHITNDLAIGLKTNLDVAEALKIKYGSTLPDKIREGETINLGLIDPAEDEKVSRRQVAEIIEARVSEIFQAVGDELKSIQRDGMLPAGLVMTGGGSELEGLTELAKKQLRLPASLGYATMPISGIVDKLDSPIYSTSIGLVVWGADELNKRAAPLRFGLGIGGVTDRIKGLLRRLTR